MYPEPGSNSISTFSCITQTIVPDSVGRTIEQQFQFNKRSTRVLWRIVRVYFGVWNNRNRGVYRNISVIFRNWRTTPNGGWQNKKRMCQSLANLNKRSIWKTPRWLWWILEKLATEARQHSPSFLSGCMHAHSKRAQRILCFNSHSIIFRWQMLNFT